MTKLPNPKVGSDISFEAPKGVPDPNDTYESGMEISHPAIAPKSNFKERTGSSSDVPIPPNLNLP